ncbi:MAG TPA: 50S ribosomal protein L11 methyltransferase [Chloroflexota bacterium]|nr:50S ribosomal protein L11 methyltransferase [Chloroflexota bacterium]
MKWLEISVETEAAAVETVSAILREYGDGGVAIEQHAVPDGEDGSYHYDSARPLTVTTYVPATADGKQRCRALAAALGHLTVFNLAQIGPPRTREVAEEDWATAWKDFYHPMRFGRRLVVKPSWRAFQAGPDDLVIELDPGMAFGTGLHQTTAMCLALLEDYVRPGASVLDQGTGSGILAIAAARLGARCVIAVDSSEVAVAAARENVARNGLSSVIQVLHGDTPHPPTSSVSRGGFPLAGGVEQGASSALPAAYDLIVANIIANVIIALAAPVAAALGPSGVLLASGIIRDREDDVRAALGAAGLALERREARDEWITLVARHA